LTKEWIRQRKRDPYYKKAKSEGYRSRAAYKLKEINNRVRLIRRGSRVLDLGASPGGWSQVAREIVGREGKVVAVDLVPMDSIEGVSFIQGDVEDEKTLEKVLDLSPHYDVVISDASPRISGNRTLDRGRSLALNWAILKMASKVLRKNGSAIVKMFQGSEVDELLDEYKSHYHNFDRLKPRSSLKRSIEIYLVFRGFIPTSEAGFKEDNEEVAP
jgi:23S rRNA (uridine2552-2'-O)-methyltransferase